MAPENELLSSWREELRQQASQGSGREELEGGGEEQEGEIEMLDENSNVEKRSLIVIARSSSEHLSGETQLEMSLSTAWRHRRSEAEHMAATEISSFMEAVQESATRILVQFDEKELEQDIEGKVIEIENQSLKFEPDR